jgi:lipopolysaccharide/colanic/teichoic acid biosynthesis glycosyltransferase
LNSIKRDNKKQLAELERLEKLEKQIAEFKKEEKTQPAPTQFGLTSRMSLKFRLIGLFTIFIAYFAYQSLSILFLILTAFIISIAIEGIIEFFQRRIGYRGIAILLAYALLIVIIL